MRMLKVNLLCIATVLLMTSVTRAKEWRGIVPLHSTRADVERLLGQPKADFWDYDFEEERAHITYSERSCQEGLPHGWNVPKDTVVEIYTVPKKDQSLSEVLLPGKDYRQVRAAHTPHIDYIDADEGLRYTVVEGMVQNITYLPSAKDKRLACGEYKYAAPVGDGVKLNSIEQVRFDSFGNISFEDAKARLDNFVIQLFSLRTQDPRWRGYIIVYAGRRAYRGEAQYRADCAKNYLVRTREMEAASLVAADGGFRNEMEFELYLGRADYYPPVLFPTVSPKHVEIIKRQLKGCAEPSPSTAAPNKALQLTAR